MNYSKTFVWGFIFAGVFSSSFINLVKTPHNAILKERGKITPGNNTLALIARVKLPKVKGGFDLMAVDVKGLRLFLAAEDNHSLEVIDLKTAKLLLSIPNFDGPKWVVYRPESNRIYVSTGGDGKVTLLNGTNYKILNSFSFREKCNNLRFDSVSRQLLVGVGKTFGSIGIIDIARNRIFSEIPLSDFPKQFEIDDSLVYVNIPAKNEIDVVNLYQQRVVSSWPVLEGKENVPMNLDRKTKRLFIACNDGRFIVFSTLTGKSIYSTTISKAADGIYFDARRSRIYISCGEGYIHIITQKDANYYEQSDKISTSKGAGTSLYSPELDKLFVAVPQIKNDLAELRIYQPGN